MRLILLFLLLPLFGKSQNDTTKYYKSFDYGWNYQRLKARAAMVLPSDTVTNKLGIVTIDTTLFVGNGSRWVKVGGTTGGGGADSSIFYTKFRSDTSRSNIYTNINTKLNKSDSTLYQTKFRSDTSRTNIYSAIGNKLNTSDSSIFYTKFRSDTSRSNIYSAIGNKLNTSDTANAFLISVSQPNDSSLTFVKGTTSTNYIIRSSVAGSATRLVTQVYNNTGSTIAKGSVVYISGRHSSNLPTIALATGNSEENSYKTFAVVENNITTSNAGTVIQAGNIGNLNLPTSSFTDGDIVYLSPTVPGGITITKPLAPNHICKIGSVTRAHPTFGAIEVKIENGWQVDELSDVKIAAVPIDSTILQFSRVDSLWHDVSINNAIGNKYLKPSDSSTYQTKYRSDSARTNTYTSINTKLNLSDSTIYQTKFRSDSARTNTYTAIAGKIGTGDSTVYQRKNIAAYSFMANNTDGFANSTAFTFKDIAVQTLSGGINWTGTSPSGTTSHSYRWCQIGKLVTLNVTLIYTTAGTNNTQVTIALPSGLPNPESPTGLTAATEMQYFGSGTMNTSTTAIITVTRPLMLRRNAANNGYEIIMTQAAGTAVKFVTLTIQYFAQ